jgi:hypothetical protein
MIEIILIFIRGWQSLDSNSGYPATRGLSTGGWRELVGVPVTVSSAFHKKNAFVILLITYLRLGPCSSMHCALWITVVACLTHSHTTTLVFCEDMHPVTACN